MWGQDADIPVPCASHTQGTRQTCLSQHEGSANHLRLTPEQGFCTTSFFPLTCQLFQSRSAALQSEDSGQLVRTVERFRCKHVRPSFFHARTHVATCSISLAVSQEQDLVIVNVLIGILSFIFLCFFVFHLEKNGHFFLVEFFVLKHWFPRFWGRFLAREMGPDVCLTHHKWCGVLHRKLSGVERSSAGLGWFWIQDPSSNGGGMR